MSASIRKRQTGPRSIALAWTNDSNSQTGDGIIRYELADYEWIAIKPMLPGQNYLIPVDGKIWNEEDVRRQGVSIDGLLSQHKASGVRVRLVVFEASRRNPYERRFGTYSHGLVPIQTSENALIPSSAAPDQVVEDPDELHSQLMTALLTQMDSSKGIDKVFNNTRNTVRAATQGQQIPAVSSKLTESVNLWPARSGAPVSAVGSAASGRRK